MQSVAHHPSSRQRREVDIASPNSFGITVDTGVPGEFRIWGGGVKFLQSLIPGIGVAEVRDHVEINRYALLRHINLTKTLGTALAGEQQAIRTMVLQNRLTLDLLTASQGGVCKLIGETCCTFIPDGYETGGDIYEALQNLTALQKYVTEHTPGAATAQGWLDWLFSGSWLAAVAKPFFLLGLIMIALLILVLCVLPCLRVMISKMITTTMTAYVAVPQEEQHPVAILLEENLY
uniref:Envelope glycoprotein n=1 Tax=Astatotilapia calliptera TaxID=8154 RepID=A0AAX7VLQ9_ASTCA